MFKHCELTSSEIKKNLRNGTICFGGNSKLKIYGTLQCKSGKRMKIENRVFFQSMEEAAAMAYRPCGNCMKTRYLKWKNGSV